MFSFLDRHFGMIKNTIFIVLNFKIYDRDFCVVLYNCRNLELYIVKENTPGVQYDQTQYSE